MAYSYNITFVMAPEKEIEIRNYIRSSLLPYIIKDNSGDMKPSLKKVMESGGKAPESDEGVSIALAIHFRNQEEATRWHDNICLPALEKFQSKYGYEALFFITLLEDLAI